MLQPVLVKRQPSGFGLCAGTLSLFIRLYIREIYAPSQQLNFKPHSSSSATSGESENLGCVKVRQCAIVKLRSFCHRMNGLCEAGLRPDLITCNAFLAACGNASLWEQSIALLRGTRTQQGI